MYFGLGWLRSAAHWYAFMCWSVWNPKREPWTSLEPLLICKAMAAPPARPCSASKELVTMLTSCTVSSAGIYVKVLSMTRRRLVSSREKLLMLVGVPLTEKFTERVGFAAKDFAFCASVTPGSVGMSNCYLRPTGT